MYDGIQTHGLVHAMRMENVFWGRMRIMLRVLELFLVALPPPHQDRVDSISRAWRELIDTVYPNNQEAREERETRLAEILARQMPMEVAEVE